MYSLAIRRRAIERGLRFFYQTSRAPENLDLYGHDYLFCLYWISSTSKDAKLSNLSWNMGQECAYRWRRIHSTVPADPDADIIANLLMGDLSANRLSVHDAGLKSQIRKMSPLFSPYDFFSFNPALEPPPNDVPEECECGESNHRGSIVCAGCQESLEMASPYEVWLDGLITSYLGERYGVKLGARYQDVIKWLPKMRPYQTYDEGNENDFIWSIYAITHVVYTLNDYSSYRLSTEGLTTEFCFLNDSLKQVIAMEDPETVGEILDSLKAFGLTNRHQIIKRGQEYLLESQNSDGSWGDMDAQDIYDRYHPTLAAINGLRDYAWCKTSLSFPKLQPLLDQWAFNEH